jgi:hypothetical protein
MFILWSQGIRDSEGSHFCHPQALHLCISLLSVISLLSHCHSLSTSNTSPGLSFSTLFFFSEPSPFPTLPHSDTTN